MRERDEELLRRFVAARDAGDAEEARRWWTELVELNHDRVRDFVDIWGRKGRLSDDERQEATQRALVKLWQNMVHSFEGHTMGEWVNSTRSLVDFACKDVQRQAARRSSRERSLDEPRVDQEGAVSSALDHALGEIALERQTRESERAEASGFLAWALPQIDERRRIVVERTLDGIPAEAIAAELGVTMVNLYQLRRRGLKDLARLWREWTR